MGPEKTQFPPGAGTHAPQRSGMGADVGDTSLAEAVATLRKRLWILILATLLGLVYGAYKAFTQPRLYVASTIIQIHNGTTNEFRLNATEDFSDDAQTKMNTEVRIITSDTMMYRVAKSLDLANNPDFMGGPGPHRSIDDPHVRANVIGSLQGHLSVALIPRTELMSLSYSSGNPILSAEIVNRVVSEYVNRAFEMPEIQTDKVSQVLAKHLDDLKANVERSQEEMMGLQRKLGDLGYDSTHSQLESSLEGLLTAEGSARIARITAESRYEMIKNMDVTTMESSIELTPGIMPAEWSGLRYQLAALHATYEQLTADKTSELSLGPNHPTVKALQAEINQLTKEFEAERSRLELQAKETYLAAKATEDATEQELDARKKEAYEQGDDKVRLTLLQREYDQNRALYEGLEQRLETAKVEAGLDSLEVDTVDKALPPENPTLQEPGRIIITNAVFFLLGGIVVAFIVESLDTGLHNIQEIETVMEMPSLAVVPRAKRAGAEQAAAMTAVQRNIQVLAQPKSQFTEAFRSLRTSLLLATAGQPPKFILFTSATPSEGKTTTASNLACILAQGEARVLLIDADLRRPNVHHRFSLTGKLGLTTVLSGASTFEEAVQRIAEVPNLDVLPSGPVPPFPTEMLSSEAMTQLLKRLGTMYSHIVIDSPPILSVTDASILGRVVDAVVLVVRHGKSNRNVMRRARDLLLRSGAPVAGLVLNAVDLNSPEYYGYYGYTGYSYGSADADSWETQSSSAGESSAGGKARR